MPQLRLATRKTQERADHVAEILQARLRGETIDRECIRGEIPFSQFIVIVLLQYFDRTSEVFDQLVMGSRSYNFSQASVKLLTLEKSQTVLGE